MIRTVWTLVDPKLRKRFAWLIIGITISSFWNVGGIASIMPFMQALSDPASLSDNAIFSSIISFTSIETTSGLLLMAGTLVLLLFVTGNAFLATITWAYVVFSRRVSMYLTTRLFEIYIAQPYAFFLERNSSDLIKNLFGETGTVARNIVNPLLQLIAEGALTISIIVFLIFVDPVVAAIAALVIGGGYGGVYLILRSILGRASRRRVRNNTRRFGIAADAFGAIKELKLRGAEAGYMAKLYRATRSFERANAQVQTIAKIPRYLLETIAFGGLLSIALVLSAGDYPSEQILPLMSAYALAGYRMMPAMQKMFAALTAVRGAHASIELLYRELGWASNAMSIVRASAEPVQISGAISIQDVQFTYASADRPALQDISIEIPVNQTLGVAGPTGCGKSTLVDIVLGLLTPQKGHICADDNVISHEHLRAWQQNFGYVPQTIYLSDSTIAENIAFGVEPDEIDMERVERAIKLASLENYIQELPEGVATSIGERGVKMSGGQRQRIGIARALYHDPAVLVFDEATSALDNSTEKAVMKAIDDLTHQKTIIIIAHRLTTLEIADRIVLLDDGRVVDKGTYTELKSRHPLFWNDTTTK